MHKEYGARRNACKMQRQWLCTFRLPQDVRLGAPSTAMHHHARHCWTATVVEAFSAPGTVHTHTLSSNRAPTPRICCMSVGPVRKKGRETISYALAGLLLCFAGPAKLATPAMPATPATPATHPPSCMSSPTGSEASTGELGGAGHRINHA